jgi:ribosomal protein S18 acetylase RimI-like enzyme
MAVDEKFRKQGIGTALTKKVIEYAKEKNASKVWLDTTPRLTEAISLYKKMGFKECGYFRKHYWGEDIKFFELLFDS